MSATPIPPEQIRIGHLRYTVSIDAAAIDRSALEAGGDRRAGESHSAGQYIRLADELAPDFAAETLLHEVLHQCLAVTGVNLDGDVADGVTAIEERAVSSIAGPLLGALRDNPDLLAYLLTPQGGDIWPASK